MNADQLLDNYNELQKVQLRNNLKAFTLKQLKKEIIKMQADKFAVTRMKRNQIIELIVQYHYLFPHLLTNQETKRTAKGKQPTVKKQPSAQLINQLINPVYNPPTLKQLASLARPNMLTQQPANYQNIPQLTYNPNQNIPQITQQHINNLNNIDQKPLEGIPSDLLQQLFTK